MVYLLIHRHPGHVPVRLRAAPLEFQDFLQRFSQSFDIRRCSHANEPLQIQSAWALIPSQIP